MKGSRTATIVHKKIDTELMKIRKANEKATRKEKAANKKNAGAPKRPASSFFVFMEEFRKAYKKNFPDNKSISIVGKAGGEKWKSMSQSEKAPYVEKAAMRKTDYEKAMKEFKAASPGNIGEDMAEEASEKSSSAEVHDDAELEASS